MKKLGLSIALAFGLLSCATTPQGKAAKAAKVTKVSVDGAGNAYLSFCTEVRKPQCIEADKAASEAGTPQTADDRIACLRPCDSATAEKIQTAVGVLRTAQVAVLEVLKAGGDGTKLEQAKKALLAAGDELMDLLRETGALDMLGRAFLIGAD